MSRLNSLAGLSVKGHVNITDVTTGEVLLDKDNAIHPQNMARIVARGLANEDNSIIHRIAFGNGGTFIDVGGRIVYRQPNDGNNGAGWESRLYRETYSEIVDEDDSNYGTDPGSAGSDNIRVGGGARPSGDPSDGGVTSEEVGKNSNVVITVYLNENEPSSQLSTQSAPGSTLEADEDTFIFDEIGLYSPGLPAVNTSGSSSIDVGNKISSDDITPALTPSTVYNIDIVIDGVTRSATLTWDGNMDGTGTGSALTYGDLAEKLNGGTGTTSITLGGDVLSDYAYFYITDQSGGAYSSIAGKESFGFFTVESLTTGPSSSVSNVATGTTSDNLLLLLANGITPNVNANTVQGQSAGVINDSATPGDERERLLSHLIFQPVLKSAASIIRIVYTITVTVAATDDSDTTTTVN